MPNASSRSSIADSDVGVICAFRCGSETDGRALSNMEITQALRNREPLWIHCNIGHSALVPWLAVEGILPEEAMAVLTEREVRHRLEFHAGGVLMVTSDFVFDEGSDPTDVAPLWIWVSPSLFLTARLHPLRTLDDLRVAARERNLPGGCIDLFVTMLQRQVDMVERIIRGVGEELDRVEDQILKERIPKGREQLGRLRRTATSIRRHFRPLLMLLQRFQGRPPHWVGEAQTRALKTVLDDLAYLVEESSHQLESAKLLQEEMSARDAESTGRNLYVLTIYTAAFLPMTLISGIFGMNLAGMPWSNHPFGFWWVGAMIVVSGLSVLFVSFRKFL